MKLMRHRRGFMRRLTLHQIQDRPLFRLIRIAHHDMHLEPVKLRLGQREGAVLLDGVLRRRPGLGQPWRALDEHMPAGEQRDEQPLHQRRTTDQPCPDPMAQRVQRHAMFKRGSPAMFKRGSPAQILGLGGRVRFLNLLTIVKFCSAAVQAWSGMRGKKALGSAPYSLRSRTRPPHAPQTRSPAAAFCTRVMSFN